MFLKKIFFAIVIIVFINFSAFSSESSNIDPVHKGLVIAGFSVFYAGMGFLASGLPFMLTGIFSGTYHLIHVSMPFFVIGYIASVFVGPIISIVANYYLMLEGLIEERVAYYPGFWYGLAWASLLAGGLLLFCSIPVGGSGAVAMRIIGGICLGICLSFLASSVTIPLCFTIKLF